MKALMPILLDLESRKFDRTFQRGFEGSGEHEFEWGGARLVSRTVLPAAEFDDL